MTFNKLLCIRFDSPGFVYTSILTSSFETRFCMSQMRDQSTHPYESIKSFSAGKYFSDPSRSSGFA